MILEPVAQYLLGQGLARAFGVDLFCVYMPLDVKNAILLVSQLGGNHINYQLPGWRKNDPFQIVVRAQDPVAGKALAWRVQTALAAIEQGGPVAMSYPADPTIPALTVRYIRPAHDPVVFPRLQSGLWEINTNFNATYIIGPS